MSVLPVRLRVLQKTPVVSFSSQDSSLNAPKKNAIWPYLQADAPNFLYGRRQSQDKDQIAVLKLLNIYVSLMRSLDLPRKESFCRHRNTFSYTSSPSRSAKKLDTTVSFSDLLDISISAYTHRQGPLSQTPGSSQIRNKPDLLTNLAYFAPRPGSTGCRWTGLAALDYLCSMVHPSEHFKLQEKQAIE